MRKTIIGLLLCCVCSGCGVMGVRHFEVWEGGPAWDFAEGLDFHIGANSIDQVDNHRGVSPKRNGETTINTPRPKF